MSLMCLKHEVQFSTKFTWLLHHWYRCIVSINIRVFRYYSFRLILKKENSYKQSKTISFPRISREPEQQLTTTYSNPKEANETRKEHHSTNPYTLKSMGKKNQRARGGRQYTYIYIYIYIYPPTPSRGWIRRGCFCYLSLPPKRVPPPPGLPFGVGKFAPDAPSALNSLRWPQLPWMFQFSTSK